MSHGHHLFRPAGTRTPGGADYPVAVDETFPPLPPATGVTVGVIDTGLVLDGAHKPHPWFGDHVSFREQDNDPYPQGHYDRYEPGYLADADGHGTFVTGLILNEARTARVIMRGVLDKDGDRTKGLIDRDDVMVAEAVRELVVKHDVKVINLSFAGGVFAEKPENLNEEIQAIYRTVAVVAAAGNGASDKPVYPAAFAEVIAVGALDERRLVLPGATPPRAAFSNYGNWVDAYAGGVQVLGPFVVYFDETGGDRLRPPQHFRGWARWSGTSFAAATVSGRIAQTAIERGITGAQAARAVLGESGKDDDVVWVRSAD